MRGLLTIGEFSRASYLSVKALRQYEDIALLRPVEVDATTGHRFYAASQVRTARLIRRLGDLDMPIEVVRRVLDADDSDEHREAIQAHLVDMEARMKSTQDSIAALRVILTDGPAPIVTHRTTTAEPVVARTEAVEWDDVEAWLAMTFVELHAGVTATGPDGALYSPSFFETHLGDVTAFVPVDPTEATRALPPATYAVIVHDGPFADIDRAYGVLGAHVAERAIGAEGAMRENYLADDRAEVCWPIRA